MKSENYLKDIGRSLFACFVLIFFAFLGQAHCQVPVSPAPEAHLQFLDSSGKPLAAGRIFTFSAGTTTLLNTYAEGTGTFANPDPIILDAGGYANIWLANASYKFVVQNSLGVQQWVVDNLSGYLGLTALNNIWSGTNTYSQPIVVSPVNNQIVFGALGVQTTIDFPPPVGTVFLHFPNTTDTMVGRATTDTLTNKTLTNPTINGVAVTGAPVFALFKNAIATAHTGTTTEDTVYTATIPILSATSMLRISLGLRPSVQGAGSTFVKVKLAGTLLDQIAIAAAGSDMSDKIDLPNRNSTAAQEMMSIQVLGTAVAAAQAAKAIDTSVSTTLLVTVTNANNGDTQTFNYILVELL